MSTSEQSSKAAPANQEHAYSPPYNPPFNGAPYPTPPPPPGPYPPPFFAYAPPQDGSHGENGPNGVPPPPSYVIPFHPGMVYAFAPPQGQVPVPPGAPVGAPSALTKPKRKQVKMACTNCAAACKRCDEGRPCERCQKYGIGDTCRDGQRKERKKGMKRGPYKRKNKNGEEWTPATAQTAATTSNAPIPVPQFQSPEGYYGPIYYPTPGTFLPHPPHEVPSGQEGSVPNGGQPPIMPYFLPYSPYPAPYGHPAMYPGAIPPGGPQPQPQSQSQAQQPQLVQPQQTVQQTQQSPNSSTETAAVPESSASGAKKKKDSGPVNGLGATENAASADTSAGVGSNSGATATSKKRTRGAKGETKSKKAKSVRNGKEKEGEGQDGGAQSVT